MLDLEDYGPENTDIDSSVQIQICFSTNWQFLKFWLDNSYKKSAQTITNSIENFLIKSKRKPNLDESGRGKEFHNNFSPNFLNNNIKHCSRNNPLGAVFAERFDLAITNFLERPLFERGESNWIDVLTTIRKQCSNRVHFSTKLTPMEGTLKKNERFVFHNFLDKRKKTKPKN